MCVCVFVQSDRVSFWHWHSVAMLINHCPFLGVHCIASSISDRCKTNADRVGGEKITISHVPPSVATTRHRITSADVAVELDGLLSPEDVFIVKGWSRGISVITILMAAYESEPFREARWFPFSVSQTCLQTNSVLSRRPFQPTLDSVSAKLMCAVLVLLLSCFVALLFPMAGVMIRSMATIHCNVIVEENPELMVCKNRGSPTYCLNALRLQI